MGRAKMLRVLLGVLLVVLVLSVSEGADVQKILASPDGGYPPLSEETVHDVSPASIHRIYVELYGSAWYHVQSPVEMHQRVLSGSGFAQVMGSYYIQPSQVLQEGVPYSLCDLYLDGTHCSYLDTWWVLWLNPPEGGVSMIVTNPITWHFVVCEPSSVLALGSGLAGLAGFVCRRRRR